MAGFDIYSTHHLLAAVKELTPATTFLKDRYFPTNEATDIFATDDVLVEYKNGSKKVAPFVSPRKGGITITREGSTMERYTPPFIAPRRELRIDDLKKRGFGEALMSGITPEQRESVLLTADMDELSELITRREEAMAAEILTSNKCIMKHYGDNLTDFVEKEISFYGGDENKAVYTPGTKWNVDGAKILLDLYAMAGMLAERGLAATDLIVGADVAMVMVNDPAIQKLFDIKNYNLGSIAPEELPQGVSILGVLNAFGKVITVFVYSEKYEDENGNLVPFIPAGKVVLTAPGAGRTLYGAITQMEQSDNQFHTHAGTRVPKYIADAKDNSRSITISAAPLLIPNNLNPWIAATVL